jgi:hypothetical protein
MVFEMALSSFFLLEALPQPNVATCETMGEWMVGFCRGRSRHVFLVAVRHGMQKWSWTMLDYIAQFCSLIA